MPQPQNQVPNRTGRGAPDASAVPFVFSMQSSSGSATVAAMPPAMPRKAFRRVMVISALRAFRAAARGRSRGVRRAVRGNGIEAVAKRERAQQCGKTVAFGDEAIVEPSQPFALIFAWGASASVLV